MGDTEEGREKQARDEERRQLERQMEAELEQTVANLEGKAVRLSRLYPTLAEFDYPVLRDEVVSETENVTLVLAEGTVNLNEVVSDSSAEEFDSVDELVSEVMSLLPQRAVGEPYQAEGEG